MVCDRSPFATAVIVRVTSVVGHSRSSMSVLIELSIAPHAPERRSIGDAMAGLAFLADHLAGALQLARHALVGRDDLVERVGDLAADAGLVAGQPHGEVAVAHRLQRAQQLLQIDVDFRLRAVALASRSCDRVPVKHGCALVLGFPSRRTPQTSVTTWRVLAAGQAAEHSRCLWRRNRSMYWPETREFSRPWRPMRACPRLVIFSSCEGTPRGRRR